MNTKTKKMVTIGMLTALATVLYYLLEIPILLPHLKMDFSDIPALIGGIILGPIAGVTIEVLKGVLHLFRSSTFGIGELINVLVGSTLIVAFCGSYRFLSAKGTKRMIAYGIAFVLAVAACILIGMISNYLLFPPYFRMLGQEVNMGVVTTAVYGSVALNTVKSVLTILPLIPFIARMETMFDRSLTH